MTKSRTIILLFSIVSLSQAGDRISIAVNDLAVQGIDQSEASVISERLRVELITTQAFRVMERSQMEVILKEQGLQQSGCTDNSCAVEIGRLLGVEHMIIGTIGRVGSLYTISIRLVNVATGEALYTASEDCRCTIEEVLTNATKNIAMKLDLAIQKAIFGTLDIKTVPDSASVYVNGKHIGKTQYFNDRFVPGTYALMVEVPTYVPIEKEITVQQKITLELSFKLEHTKAYTDSIFRANRKQHMHRLVCRQLIISALAAACGGAGYYFDKRLMLNVNDKDAAYNVYRNAGEGSNLPALWKTYQNTGKDIETQKNTRNILYVCAGALALGFGVSFAF
jgi:TolB-like protein